MKKGWLARILKSEELKPKNWTIGTRGSYELLKRIFPIKKKRTHVYVHHPYLYEIAGCKCGNNKTQ